MKELPSDAVMGSDGHRTYRRRFLVDGLPAVGEAYSLGPGRTDSLAVCVHASEPVHRGHGVYEIEFTYTTKGKV